MRTECLNPEPGTHLCYRGLKGTLREEGRAHVAQRPQQANPPVDAIKGEKIRRKVRSFSQLHGITETIADSMAELF